MWPRLNLSWKWSGLKLEENSPLKEHREYCSWLILWLYTECSYLIHTDYISSKYTRKLLERGVPQTPSRSATG